jgi:ubiquinone/menaquinone biosynthesis C-methylase UbiE
MSVRHDTIWQDESVAANFGAIQHSIPFVDVHFDIMHRLLAEAGVEVRNLLDLGAGDGIVTSEVMRRQPVASATLTDFSQPFLDKARERFADSSLDVHLVAGDFRETDWHDQVTARGPFDVVVSRFAIHHIPDEMKIALYTKVLEWLKPGGMFVQIEHVASASDLYNAAHDRLMVERITATSGDDANFDDVFASYRVRADGGANILAPVWDQLQWLCDIGYVDVDCAFKCFELSVFAGRKPQKTKGPSS